MKRKKSIFFTFLIIYIGLISNSLFAQDIDKAFQYFNNQQYKKAALEFENALPSITKEYGQNDTIIYTRLLLFIAISNNKSMNINNAEKYFIKCKSIYENIGDTLNLVYARSLNGLASLYHNKGNYEKAMALYIEAINIRKEFHYSKNIDYALSLNDLATLFHDMGDYVRAEQMYIQALRIKKELVGVKNLSYAATLNNLALLYNDMSKYEKAESLYIEVISIDKEIKGIKHPDYATDLNNLALLYNDMGKFEKAKSLHIEAMNIRKDVFGKKHPDYSNSLNNLAAVYFEMSNYEKAKSLLIEAMNILNEAVGEKHPEYATTLNNLAELYFEIGNYEKAEPLYIEAMNIRKESFGEKHKDYSISLANLGKFYFNIGNYEKTRPLFIEAKNIFKEALGEKHPKYATALNNLAELYFKIGNYEKAKPIHVEAMNIRKESLGKKHPDYAQSLHNLAKLYISIGNYNKAEPLATEAMNIRKESLGKKHPDYALCLNNLAFLHNKIGNYRKVESLYIEAKNILNEAVGEKHPEYATTLNNLALLNNNMGNYEKAKSFFVKANNVLNFRIKQVDKFMSEKEKEIFLNSKINYYFDIYNSFFLERKRENPSLIGISYNNALQHKGLLLQSSIAMRQTILNSGNNELIDLYEHYIATGKRLGQLYSQPELERKVNTDSLNAVTNVLEKELTNYVNLTRVSDVTYKNIRKSLQKDEAAIEFIHFRYYDKEWTDSILYCALILGKDYEYPEMIYLSKEKDIEKLLHRDDHTSDYNYIKNLYEPGLQKSDSLYSLTWEPLNKFLDDIQTVYISPSGLLNRIAFDAIPSDNQHILSDKYKIIYTSNTAKICDQEKLYTKDIDKVVLFGGIEYKADINQIQKEVAQYKNEDRNSKIFATRGNYFSLINETTRDLVWRYLPGSQTEVERISNIFIDNNKNHELFSGLSGSEEAFKKLSNNSPSVLHISTHGFYFSNYERPNKGSQMYSNKVQYIHSKYPLMRSGILLAGAQNAFNNKEIPFNLEDGILTAYEVSHLNLMNTDLAVLSACQTGLGELKGNEGVYGLQRSFKMAGVDYLLVSLWKVPDYQTRELMINFYNNWFSDLEIRDAFKKAQNHLKNKYEGVPGSVFNWAAFILIN